MISNDLLDVQKILLAEIPCLYIKPRFISGELPTVVFYHGWHSRKENNGFLAQILACNGYSVILPDDLDHGERGSIDYDTEYALENNFWRIVLNGVDEFKGIIDDAVRKLGIDTRRIAVGGSSMGGFIASGIFAANTNIRTLVCFNGGSAWEEAEKEFEEKAGWEVLPEEQLAKIRQYDPLRYKETIYPRPVLLLHGDSDTQVYIQIQRHFIKEISKLYSDYSEKIKLFEVPRLNHDKTVSMIEEMLEWLNKYL